MTAKPKIDAQASDIPKVLAHGQDVTPLKQAPLAHEPFTFGNATMKLMPLVCRLIEPAASVASISVALIAIGEWWLFLVAIGLVLRLAVMLRGVHLCRSKVFEDAHPRPITPRT